MSELDKINKNFVEKLNKIKTKEDLQNLKSEFLGKNGFVTNEFKKMSQFNLDQKKEFSIQLKRNHHKFLFLHTILHPKTYFYQLLGPYYH